MLTQDADEIMHEAYFFEFSLIFWNYIWRTNKLCLIFLTRLKMLSDSETKEATKNG